jgi:hypothetical protein
MRVVAFEQTTCHGKTKKGEDFVESLATLVQKTA